MNLISMSGLAGWESGVEEQRLPCGAEGGEEVAMMSGGAIAVKDQPVSSGTGGTADRNRSHWST